MIDGEVKKDISRSQSGFSRKVPDMNPCLFEGLGIGASRVSSAVHFVHSPEDDFQVICLDEIEEYLVLCIKPSVCHFLGGEGFWSYGDMIDFVCAHRPAERIHNIRDFFASRIENEGHDRHIEIVFLLDFLHVFYGVVC